MFRLEKRLAHNYQYQVSYTLAKQDSNFGSGNSDLVGVGIGGVITDNYLRDPGDPTQRKDPAVKLYFRLMGKYGPNGARLTDILYLYGMAKAHTFVTTLYQAGKNPTRDSLMRAATHLNEKNPFLLAGITIKTSPSQQGHGHARAAGEAGQRVSAFSLRRVTRSR